MHADHILTRNSAKHEEIEFLEDKLYEYNSAQIRQADGQLFSFFIRDARGEIVAGIHGWTWANASEIRLLWVHPSWRRQGYGRRLLAEAEQEARSHGCSVILLSSYSFQAPEFYKKCGYALAWQLKDFPPGHTYCYLVKRLRRTGP